MRPPEVDDFVRLLKDIPELGLTRNEVGIVRSTWFAPSVAYEVEFRPRGQDFRTRALLMAEQVQVEDLIIPKEDFTSRRDKQATQTTFNGYPAYYIEGSTRKEYLYRYVFDANGRWHQIILSSPLPLDFEGSDWQEYLQTFRAAEDSATTEPSTAPSSRPS